jgi:hypothetical protein
LFQFVEEAEIQVHLFVSWAVEGAGGAFGFTANVAEEDQLGVTVGTADLIREELFPA